MLSRKEIEERIRKRIELNTHLEELKQLRIYRKKHYSHRIDDDCRNSGWAIANFAIKKGEEYIDKKYQKILWALFYLEKHLDKNSKNKNL